VLAGTATMGQGLNSRCPVYGEIQTSALTTGGLTVELSSYGQAPSETALVNPVGNFELHPVEGGFYELRVLGPAGVVVHRQNIVASCSREPLAIRIPDHQTANRDRLGDSISIRQLNHKVPPAARKAFEKGEQAQARGNRQQAEEMFRQAVGIDPEFADAYNELGASVAEHGDLPQAIENFQKAIDVVPEHRQALANLSIALAKSRRFDEAATAARRALQFMPASGTVRYILATSLWLSTGDSEEVLDNLERSSKEVPIAHLLAAEILTRRGKRAEAAQHVEDYLRVVPADDKHRSQAEAMLVDLRS
jgi:tetratricopeptide (TPR) repeat protein